MKKNPLSKIAHNQIETDSPGPDSYLDYNWVNSKVTAQLYNGPINATDDPSPNPNRRNYEVGSRYYQIGNYGGEKCIESVYVMAHLQDDLYFVDYYDGKRFQMCGFTLGTENKFELPTYELAKVALDKLMTKGGDNGGAL